MKIIYSKKFPPITEQLTEPLKLLTEEEKRVFEYTEESHFTNRNIFINYIITLSSDYQIDSNIYEYKTYLKADMYFSNITFTEYMTRIMTMILMFTDSFSVFIINEPDNPKKLLISFIHNLTHPYNL